MKNKLGLLLLQVVFVVGLANAQNNIAQNINNSLNDYEVEDEFDDDFTELTYSFQLFEKIVDAIHYQNYKKQMCTPFEGQYVSTFVQGLDESFMIVAISNHGFQEEVKNAQYKAIKHRGQTFYYGTLWNDEQGKFDDHILLKECPQYGVVISILGPVALSKENLWCIVNQFDF